MTRRTPVIGGNWKMNLDGQEAIGLAKRLAEHPTGHETAEVVIFPPFPYLDRINGVISQAATQSTMNKIAMGAQDFYHQSNGAFTGEVSLSMLRDVGVQVVLAGHSERRHILAESDGLVNRKVRAALDAGFKVILCVGETLEQRQLDQTDAINTAQTHYGLAGVASGQMSGVTIAYEPVWAIGTGKTATASDAQKAHQAIRSALAAIYGHQVAQAVRILYGGSVKAANAAQLFCQPDIDGGLIGGASLESDQFTAIIDAAVASGSHVREKNMVKGQSSC